jgi:hypothetical protein
MLFISSTLCKICSFKLIRVEGTLKFMKRFKGFAGYKSLGASAIEQGHYIKVPNTLFENVAKLKYLETTLTQLSCIYEDINNSLNPRNACCHTVHNLLSSHAPTYITNCLLHIVFFIHSRLNE